MAESYLTRRGSTGGGGLGGMNVTIGTSPPSDKVGLFVNSETIDTDICYVSPNGIGSGGSWTILNSLTPENTNYSFPAVSENTSWIGTASGNLYSFDKNSELFSQISTNNKVYNGFSYIIMWHYDGNLYCCGNVGNAANDNSVFKMAPDSTTWTDTGYNITGASVFFGCMVYNAALYVLTSRNTNRRWGISMISYDIGAGTSSILFDGLYTVTNQIYFGTLVEQNNLAYCFGAQIGQQFAFRYDILANISTSFGNVTAVSGMANTPCGFLFNNKLYCTGGNTQTLAEVSIPIETTSTWQTSEMVLPMVQSNRDHTGQCVNFGDKIFLFNCGANFQGIMKFIVNSSFPHNSVIVECSLNGNECEIVSSEDGNITVSVGKVYYIDDSGNMSEITSQCQVRTTGGNWQQIQ